MTVSIYSECSLNLYLDFDMAPAHWTGVYTRTHRMTRQTREIPGPKAIVKIIHQEGRLWPSITRRVNKTGVVKIWEA